MKSCSRIISWRQSCKRGRVQKPHGVVLQTTSMIQDEGEKIEKHTYEQSGEHLFFECSLGFGTRYRIYVSLISPGVVEKKCCSGEQMFREGKA
jgi:hypothetical protein